MALELITPPGAEPVTLAEMKVQCGLGPMEDTDQLREQLVAEKLRPAIVAARQRCEALCSRVFITQQWKMTLQHFPHWHIEYEIPFRLDIPVPLPTLQTIDDFTYIDIGGTVQPMSGSGAWGYQLVEGGDTRMARLRPPIGRLWPVTLIQQADAVSLTFTCGFGSTPAALPWAVRTAVKMMAQWLYDGAKGQEPEAVAALLSPYVIEVL